MDNAEIVKGLMELARKSWMAGPTQSELEDSLAKAREEAELAAAELQRHEERSPEEWERVHDIYCAERAAEFRESNIAAGKRGAHMAALNAQLEALVKSARPEDVPLLKELIASNDHMRTLFGRPHTFTSDLESFKRRTLGNAKIKAEATQTNLRGMLQEKAYYDEQLAKFERFKQLIEHTN